MDIDHDHDREIDDDVEMAARRAIVRALNRDPYDVWTRDSLARSLGLSAASTGKILNDLARAGMVHRLHGEGEGGLNGFTVVGDDELLV